MARERSGGYTADDIDLLSPLEGVRKKPGMYVGGVDRRGVLQCWKEIKDNASDEAVNSGEPYVGCQVEGDLCRVWDKGRGIPVEKHPKAGVSTLQVVLTELHAGGKLSSKGSAYKKGSAGTHGVGASVTNALSRKMVAYTFRDGQWYTQTYRAGVPDGTVEKCDAPKVPGYGRLKRGTLIEFELDKSIFKDIRVSRSGIQEMLELDAYLHPGVTYEYWERDRLVETFYEPEGTKALLRRWMRKLKVDPMTRVEHLQVSSDHVEVALQWTTLDDEQIQSYACGSRTTEGGTHLRGLFKAIGDAIEPYRGRRDFKAEDARHGVMGVLNFTVQAPSFEGQTKGKLANTDDYDATKMVYDVVYPALKKHFKEHPTLAKDIVERAASIREVNTAAAIKRKAAIAMKAQKAGKVVLPSELADAMSSRRENTEVFIVEGESAGGEAKKARDKETQGVLGLGGKILNVAKVKPKEYEKIFENEEVMILLQSLGYNPKAEDPVKTLRFGRIILMSDADEDGKHINVLLLTLLAIMMPKVFDEGRVYMVDALLFTAEYKGHRYYGHSLDDVLKQLPKGAPTNIVRRLKGWGEASGKDIWNIALNPKTRRLIKVTATNAQGMKDMLALVGESTAARKELLGLPVE